ncbi:MAG: NAD+ synthase, partial [Gammaproteobacteria bacterium]|nr:NAD+ synthase [Gammaproteobacteria bacterium]
MSAFEIVMLQLNTLVGDFDGNVAQILEQVAAAEQRHQRCVLVFPELTLCGYPPEDLLLRSSMEGRVDRALQAVCEGVAHSHVVVGYPRRVDGKLYNMAGMIHAGELVAEYAKHCLPNYQVFDEKRYFEAGNQVCVIPVHGVQVGLSICEDIWEAEPARLARAAGAEVILNLNASPFHRGKSDERRQLVAARAQENGIPVVYVNQVGGQDELVFDGGSFAVNADGRICAMAPHYEVGSYAMQLRREGGECVLAGTTSIEPMDEQTSVYQALVLGVKDYVDKNHFKGVVLGLSGGIDSALTLAVAVDALGADRVEAVMMPFRYTSQMSVEDAAEQSRRMGVSHKVISIESVYAAFMASLEEEFAGTRRDTTEENLQARCRGVLLMSISNKKGLLVLTTGNKSEMAVGYST